MKKITSIKFVAVGTRMLKVAGEKQGRENVKGIMNAHNNMQPFAPIGVQYEGFGWIAYALGLTVDKTNKINVKSRKTEKGRMSIGYTNASKASKDDPQCLYTWQEWKDNGGFTEEENKIISAACGGDPSYIFTFGSYYTAYFVSTKEVSNASEWTLYLKEDDIISYNEGMLGLKKQYNTKGNNGDCITTYKTNEEWQYTANFSSFMDLKGVEVKDILGAIEDEVKKFEEALIVAINNESKARIEANAKIEKEKEEKEALKKVKEEVKTEMANATKEDWIAFQEFMKARKNASK